MKNNPCIAAASEMRPGRYPAEDGVSLYQKVLKELLREWPIKPSDVGGLFVAPAGMVSGNGADVFIHERLIDDLGIHPTIAETINAGGATYSVMIQRAALAIEKGLSDGILCIGAGKFPKVGAGGAEEMAKILSHPEFEFPYGTAVYALYALVATAHMEAFGTAPEQLARVAVSERKWALHNPKALMRDKGALSIEDVLASRMIATPFHLLDCSVPCEGGGAVLVCSEAMAKKINPNPAYILGFGEKHDYGFISQSRSFTSLLGASDTGKAAFKMAGLTPKDIDFVELYDAFSINPIVLLEDLGFVPKGKGGPFIMEGHTDPGGDLPSNTYGGLLSFGHTGDASGISMIIEGALQIMGKAPGIQLEKAEVCLVHTYGGMMAEHATLILGRHA